MTVQSYDEVINAPEEKEKVELPPAYIPPDTLVTLPVGLWHPGNTDLIKQAEVRELNGEDEEAIARITSKAPHRYYQAILERGTVRIGDDPATPNVLEVLTVADIDYLLMSIRRVTYGDTVDVELPCPECQTDLRIEVDLDKEVEVKTVNSVADLFFSVKLRSGAIARCSLITGAEQKLILDGKDRTNAEINTLLLSGVVKDIDGLGTNMTTIRRLGMKDRQTLLNAIAEHTPGPQLGEVKQQCPECKAEIPLSLSMADLFLLS